MDLSASSRPIYSFLSYRQLAKTLAQTLRADQRYQWYNGFEHTTFHPGAVAVVDDQLSLEQIHRLAQKMPLISFDSLRQGLYQAFFLPVEAQGQHFLEALERFWPTHKEIKSFSWLGQGPLFNQVREHITLAAAHRQCPILIAGESGTGKELAALSIHEKTFPDKSQPFIALNCAALSLDLIDTELFGHEKGAFTGAINSRKGKFELAAEGTLFLDEIGDMPLSTQVKLLRVLQEKQFERLGSNETHPFKARIICATHQPLEQLMAQKLFREDLYYRIHVLSLKLPPLRSYLDELEDLTHYLLRQHHFTFSLSTEAIEALKNYHWPGNIRQLLNVLKRADIFFHHKKISSMEIQQLLASEPQTIRLAQDLH